MPPDVVPDRRGVPCDFCIGFEGLYFVLGDFLFDMVTRYLTDKQVSCCSTVQTRNNSRSMELTQSSVSIRYWYSLAMGVNTILAKLNDGGRKVEDCYLNEQSCKGIIMDGGLVGPGVCQKESRRGLCFGLAPAPPLVGHAGQQTSTRAASLEAQHRVSMVDRIE